MSLPKTDPLKNKLRLPRPANQPAGQAEAGKDDLPYRLREHFLSAPEMALYKVLKAMAEGRFTIHAKVSLNEIFYIVRPNENVHFFNKIFRKHVDFLLCDVKTMEPRFGVELVKPIAKNETRTTDQFMEDIFLGAGLPLVHIPSSDHYDIKDIISLFQLAVTKSKSAVVHRSNDIQDSVPMCPVCGKLMVLRTYRSGAQSGQLYYGCVDNPKCPGHVPIK